MMGTLLILLKKEWVWKMNNFQIYLAGKMSGISYEEMFYWRDKIKKSLQKCGEINDYPLRIINPVEYYNFEHPRHKSEREVMEYDLLRVRNSNLVIVNVHGLNTSIGTSIELHEANCRHIPIIAYDPENEYEFLHPWLQCFVSRVENNIDSLNEYITDFYIL